MRFNIGRLTVFLFDPTEFYGCRSFGFCVTVKGQARPRGFTTRVMLAVSRRWALLEAKSTRRVKLWSIPGEIARKRSRCELIA